MGMWLINLGILNSQQ